MVDSQIVDLYLRRNEQAIEETARKYGRYCHTIAYNILESDPDAEEVVNDTYLGAWSSIPPHRPAILSTYLGKITRRLSLMKWKSKHAAKRGGGEITLALEELEGCICTSDTPEKALEMAELSRHLNRFILSLPDTEQRVFVCRYWYVYSIETIASQFGFSQSKVKSMLSRTRNKLRTYLRKEEIYL